MKTEGHVFDFESELRDRFGKPPSEVTTLLKIMRIKIVAKALSIVKIQESKGKVRIVFSPDTPVKPEDIFGLHNKKRRPVKFFPDGFELDLKSAEWEKVFEGLYGALEELNEKIGVVA